jgi:hypothetical protein
VGDALYQGVHSMIKGMEEVLINVKTRTHSVLLHVLKHMKIQAGEDKTTELVEELKKVSQLVKDDVPLVES